MRAELKHRARESAAFRRNRSPNSSPGAWTTCPAPRPSSASPRQPAGHDLDRAQPGGASPRREARGSDGLRGVRSFPASAETCDPTSPRGPSSRDNGELSSHSDVPSQNRPEPEGGPSRSTWDAAHWRAHAGGDGRSVQPLRVPRLPVRTGGFRLRRRDGGLGSACMCSSRTRPDAFLGAAPCYLKSHSMGEYVFDHSWADAYSAPAALLSQAPGRGALHARHRPAPARAPGRRAGELRTHLIEGCDRARPDRRLLDPRSRSCRAGWSAFREWLPAARRPAIPLVQRRLRDLRRLPGGARLAQAQGDPARAARGARGRHLHRMADRARHHRGALGRLLRLLHGYGLAQMGPALSHPPLLLAHRRAHGRPRAAGDGQAQRPLHRGRHQLHRLRHALRPQLGLHRGPSVPAFRGLLLPGDRLRHRRRASTGSRPARRASTSWRAATGPSPPTRRTTSPTRPCAGRSRPISSRSAATCRRPPRSWPRPPRSVIGTRIVIRTPDGPCRTRLRGVHRWTRTRSGTWSLRRAARMFRCVCHPPETRAARPCSRGGYGSGRGAPCRLGASVRRYLGFHARLATQVWPERTQALSVSPARRPTPSPSKNPYCRNL